MREVQLLRVAHMLCGRKEMYEAQLAQIEKDIEKLSKKNVYIRDDA